MFARTFVVTLVATPLLLLTAADARQPGGRDQRPAVRTGTGLPAPVVVKNAQLARNLPRFARHAARVLRRWNRGKPFHLLIPLLAQTDDHGRVQTTIFPDTVARLHFDPRGGRDQRGAGRLRFSVPVRIDKVAGTWLAGIVGTQFEHAGWSIAELLGQQIEEFVDFEVHGVRFESTVDGVLVTPEVTPILRADGIAELGIPVKLEPTFPFRTPRTLKIEGSIAGWLQWLAGDVPVGASMKLHHDQPVDTELHAEFSGDQHTFTVSRVMMKNAQARWTHIRGVLPFLWQLATGAHRSPSWLRPLQPPTRFGVREVESRDIRFRRRSLTIDPGQMSLDAEVGFLQALRGLLTTRLPRLRQRMEGLENTVVAAAVATRGPVTLPLDTGPLLRLLDVLAATPSSDPLGLGAATLELKLKLLINDFALWTVNSSLHIAAAPPPADETPAPPAAIRSLYHLYVSSDVEQERPPAP
jgi:hypothetical protein